MGGDEGGRGRGREVMRAGGDKGGRCYTLCAKHRHAAAFSVPHASQPGVKTSKGQN